MRVSVALAMVAATTLASVVAHADIAPPPGWKETCTEDQQKKPGEECVSCRAYYGNAQHCTKLLASYAFQSRCKTRGASVWSELWCRGGGNAKKLPANIVTALGNPNDDGTTDSGVTAPTSSADAATSAVPSTTAEPSTTTTASTSAAPTTSPTTSTSAAPETKLPTEDTSKKGACGACAVGASSSSSAELTFAALAFAAVVSRRRRRSPITTSASSR